jgi:anti-anti-sigma factor
MIGVPVQQGSLALQTQTRSDATIVSLGGDLTQAAVQQARAALFEALQGRPKRFVADLARIQVFQEAGIGILLIVSLWAHKWGVEFAIVPSQAVRDRLTAANLDQHLRFVEPGSVPQA